MVATISGAGQVGIIYRCNTQQACCVAREMYIGPDDIITGGGQCLKTKWQWLQVYLKFYCILPWLAICHAYLQQQNNNLVATLEITSAAGNILLMQG